MKDRFKFIRDVFSRRKVDRGLTRKPDEISDRVRKRILLLVRDVFSGRWTDSEWSSPGDHTREFWEEIHNKLEHLYGRAKLSSAAVTSLAEDALAFVATCSAEEFFDFLEMSFKVDACWRVLSDENVLVEAINEIFKIESAPYQMTPIVKREEERPQVGPLPSGKTIRTVAWPKVVRSEEEVTFVEAVAPALSALGGDEYEAANLEFRDALDEYRKGHYGDCLVKCGSAFESVLKVICNRQGWTYDPSDTVAPLLKLVLSHTTLEKFFKQPLILVATLRNRMSSAHGGGSSVRSVGRHVAQFAITSTAAAIVLLEQEVGG